MMEVLFQYVFRGLGVNSGQVSQGMDLQVIPQSITDSDPPLLLSARK